MTERIRVGIVGATVTQGGSGWGANAHVPALRALPRYELKAVCTAHEDTARASAAAFGVERAFHRFGDMVADPEIDLVVVCVRVPGHRDLAEGEAAGVPPARPVLQPLPGLLGDDDGRPRRDPDEDRAADADRQGPLRPRVA